MIKANELRIGNLLWPLGAIECQTAPVTIYGNDIASLEAYPDECEGLIPIPLTEEWLLKLGFEKKEAMRFGGVKYVFEHDVKTNSGLKQYVLIDDHFDMIYESGRRHLQYVHQLQNLYFALTGEELQLKPEPTDEDVKNAIIRQVDNNYCKVLPNTGELIPDDDPRRK